MIIRCDLIRPNPAPKHLLEVCRSAGGLNPYKEPLVRLCLAQDRVMKAAGEWNIFDENTPVEERGGLGLGLIQKMLVERQDIIQAAVQKGFSREDIEKIVKRMSGMIDEVMQECLARHPKAVFSGMADDVEVYPNEGWILEKWKPAEAFGAPEDWYRYTFQGIAALGPYPTFGAYELFAGPSPELPTEDEIRLAISRHFQEIDSRPRDPKNLVVQMMSAREERNRKKREARKADIQAALSDSPASLHNRVSLGAGRVISELAEKAGLKGHYGN